MKIPTPRLELFLTDVHADTYDPDVVSLELQVAKALKPDMIWFNGDNIDGKSISRFRIDPSQKRTLRNEITSFKDLLRRFQDACPASHIYVKDGNHDKRVQMYIWDHAEELADFEEVSIPKLLNLKEAGIVYIPEDKMAKVGELWHIHGHEVKVGFTYPAQKMLIKVNEPCIFGHVHRFSVFHSNSISGRVHEAWSIGCTQSLKVDFDLHPQWSQGFAIIEYTSTGLFHVNPVVVFKDKGRKACMVYGKTYYASNL